jgi:hypothetical protein
MSELFDAIDRHLRFTRAMRKAEAVVRLEDAAGPIDLTKPNGRAKAARLGKLIRELDKPNRSSYDSGSE